LHRCKCKPKDTELFAEIEGKNRSAYSPFSALSAQAIITARTPNRENTLFESTHLLLKKAFYTRRNLACRVLK
jgi:hypothetical protein